MKIHRDSVFLKINRDRSYTGTLLLYCTAAKPGKTWEGFPIHEERLSISIGMRFSATVFRFMWIQFHPGKKVKYYYSLKLLDFVDLRIVVNKKWEYSLKSSKMAYNNVHCRRKESKVHSKAPSDLLIALWKCNFYKA